MGCFFSNKTHLWELGISHTISGILGSKNDGPYGLGVEFLAQVIFFFEKNGTRWKMMGGKGTHVNLKGQWKILNRCGFFGRCLVKKAFFQSQNSV